MKPALILMGRVKPATLAESYTIGTAPHQDNRVLRQLALRSCGALAQLGCSGQLSLKVGDAVMGLTTQENFDDMTHVIWQGKIPWAPDFEIRADHVVDDAGTGIEIWGLFE